MKEAKLIKLVKPELEVDQDLVEAIETLLEGVKDGSITEVVAAYTKPDVEGCYVIHNKAQMRWILYAAETIKSRVAFG